MHHGLLSTICGLLHKGDVDISLSLPKMALPHVVHTCISTRLHSYDCEYVTNKCLTLNLERSPSIGLDDILGIYFFSSTSLQAHVVYGEVCNLPMLTSPY